MLARILVLFMLVTMVFGEFEVIKIMGPLSERTLERLWPVFSNGAISLNEHELVIPDGTQLYLQKRFPPFDQTTVQLKRHPKEHFTIYETSVTKSAFAYTVLASDGRFYLFKKNRRNGDLYGPVPKHGLADRMILLPDDRLIASGLYRPRYTTFLDLYDDNTQRTQTQKSKDMFLQLYETDKAFSLAIYDSKLTLIDSGNVIDRIGENAQWFERLYLNHTFDITQKHTIYLIDSDKGYVVEEYSALNVFVGEFKVANTKFKNIPENINKDILNELRKTPKSYSVPYALYIKDEYIITSFFQSPAWREPIEPPYYYDISSLGGTLVDSGEICYPILCEDEGNKVFLLVTIDGGWFGQDNHFLVGVTIQDILENRVSKVTIDESVRIFQKELAGNAD